MHLPQFLERQKKPLTLAAVAKECGVSRQLVNKWLAGQQRPALKHQLTIERLTGGAVTREAWREQYSKPEGQRDARRSV